MQRQRGAAETPPDEVSKGGAGCSEDDLSCPVCHQLFKDPCFVCTNHHTLCRGCYQAISAGAAPETSSCPLCRERLTQPVENASMRRLVEDHEQSSRTQQAACQAKEGTARCQGRAVQHCEHCNRDLCDAHLQKDQLDFKTNCQKLLSSAIETAKWADTEEKEFLKELDAIIDNFRKLLENRRVKVRGLLASTAPAIALRADTAALRAALEAGDLGLARVASDRLAETRRLCEERSAPPDPRPDEVVDRLNSRNFADVADELQKLCQSDADKQRLVLGTAKRLREQGQRRCSVQ